MLGNNLGNSAILSPMASWKATDYLSGKRWEFDTKEEAQEHIDKFKAVLGQKYPILLEYF